MLGVAVLATIVLFPRAHETGFVDKNGRLVINLHQAGVREVGDFHEGMAWIKRYKAAEDETAITYITKDGQTLPAEFQGGDNFSEGLAPVVPKHSSKWGYINKAGTFVIPPQFEACLRFSDGLAPAQKDMRWGYIDKSGKFSIQPRFETAEAFKNGVAVVQEHDGYGVIDKTGSYVVEPNYGKVFACSDGIIVARRKTEEHGRTVAEQLYFDAAGRLLHKCPMADYPGFLRRSVAQFDDPSFSCGLGAYCRNGKYGYVDKAFRMVIPATFNRAARFADGRAVVAKSETKHLAYIDQSGALATDFKFDFAENFAEGFAVAGGFQHLGYINLSGAYVISPKFETAGQFSEGKAFVAPSQICL